MDEDGYAHFSAIENLALRARVSVEACNAAVTVLSAPDQNSADPDNDGRRIERVSGGFVVLNAGKYRDIVTALNRREQTRLRVKKHREKKLVTQCNDDPNFVTPPSAYAYECTTDSSKGVQGEINSGMPSTADEAVAMCMNSGVPEDFIRDMFAQADSRGFKDGSNVPITKWPGYVKRRHNIEISKPKPTNSNYGNQRIQRTVPDHKKPW